MNNLSLDTSTTEGQPIGPQGPDVGLTINAILKIIYYSAVMLLGLFGNSLILGVYWSKPNKTSTHILIMGLAGMDLTVCLMRVHNLAVFISFLANKETPSAFQYINVLGLVNLYASSVLTGVIAVDRYDCVCRPQNRWMSRSRAKLMIPCSYGLSIIFTSPRIVQLFWLYNSIALKKTFLACQCVLYVVVLVVICVCYGQVYMTIRKHVKVHALSQRQAKNDLASTSVIVGNMALSSKDISSTSRGSESGTMIGTKECKARKTAQRIDQSVAATRDIPLTDGPQGNVKPNQPNGKYAMVSLQRKTTRMLFVTSVVFLVAWFPYWLYIAVALAFLNGSEIDPNVLQVLKYCTVPAYINNVVNPLIYGIANRRFRKNCLDVLNKIKMC